MFFDYTRDIIQKIWKNSEKITETEFYENELRKWENSPERLMQIMGYRYYKGEHDILLKKRTAIGQRGEVVQLDNLPNSRIIDNRYSVAVDQKVNYLLGKPLTVRSEAAAFEESLKEMFNRRYSKLMKNTLRESLNSGIAWHYVYYNKGEFAIKLLPGYEVLPFWADNEHTELDCAARLYSVTSYEGKRVVIRKKVELYKPEGVYKYSFDNGQLKAEIEEGAEGNFTPYADNRAWSSIPLIAFKYRDTEQPLIRRVKSLQDGLNLLLSMFADNMQEDTRNTILIIKNYDGEDLGQFRRNLATYGAVKVKTVDGSQGGVEALSVEVNAENYKAIIDIFKKTIIENALTYDGKDERLGGNPNQMNIQSMYMDIDLDANEIETEYQAALESEIEFYKEYLKASGKGNFEKDTAEIIFNRDMLINEGEVIDNCIKSLSILSKESVIAQHPWTDDVAKELQKLQEEEESPYKGSLGGDD